MSDICTFSNPLPDETLIAFLSGEASDSAVMHIQNCSFCAARARKFSNMQDLLKRNLFRRNCPKPLQLSEYYLKLLPASQMNAIRLHIANCPHCAAELADLDTFFDATPIPLSAQTSLQQHLEILWEVINPQRIIGRFFAGESSPQMQIAVTPVKGHSPQTDELYRFSISPDDHTDIDAEFVVYRQDNPTLVSVQVQATIPSIWPQAVALQVTLIGKSWIRSATTGDDEQVIFTNINRDELPSISFEITPIAP